MLHRYLGVVVRGEDACAEAKVPRIAKARIVADQHRVTVV